MTSEQMKRDWNTRARASARQFIATSEPDEDARFTASGRRDVDIFFDGLTHLLTPARTVLDIGCGMGRMDEHVAGRVGKLIGLDVSGEMIAGARERLAKFDNVEFHEGSGWDLAPVASDSVDLVFSHIVFQHMPKAAVWSYFRDVRRVLRKGGDFVFQVPEANDSTPPDPPDGETLEMRFFGEDEVRRRLVMLGFRPVGADEYPIETVVIDFNQLRIHARR